MGKIKIDDRGRITIPKKIRKKLLLKQGEELEIGTEGDKIILKPEKNKIKKVKSKKEWDESTFLDAGDATFASSK